MSQKKYILEQIIGMLREAEVLLSQGQTTADASRQLSVSEQRYYRWRKEYGDLQVDLANPLEAADEKSVDIHQVAGMAGLDVAFAELRAEPFQQPHLVVGELDFALGGGLLQAQQALLLGEQPVIYSPLRFRTRGDRYCRQSVSAKEDKITRLSTVSAHIEAGYVPFPKQAPWLDELLLELLQFPGGRHDDQVDSMTQLLGWVRARRTRTIQAVKTKGH